MGNALISFRDRTLEAALSGGSWQGAAPLANLNDPQLSHVARTTDISAPSSIIQVDIGMGYPNDIRVISLCAHNISSVGTIRVRGYANPTFTTMVTGADSGVLNAWPAGFDMQTVDQYPKNWTFVFPTSKTARWWKIEITDTTNPNGYIEVGRCWIGRADFEPATGISYGMTLGYTSRDVIEESLGGVPWGERRTPIRSLVARFPFITTNEKRQALIMQKTLSETSEVLWITNGPAVADDMLLEAFPAFLRRPSALTYPYYNNHELAIEVVERV